MELQNNGPTTTIDSSSAPAASSLSQYILPCPMGLELAMENAVKSASARADIGPPAAAVQKQRTCTVSIKRLFPLIEYDTIDLQNKLIKQFSRQEERAKAKSQRKNSGWQNNRRSATSSSACSRHSSANSTSAVGNIIAGTLNDGRNTSIGQYRDDIVVVKPGATELTLMLLETDAPVEVVSSIRCIGPILALVAKKENVLNDHDEGSSMSGDEVSNRIESLGREEETIMGFRRALSLWSHHARSWSQTFGIEAAVDSLEVA